ncbi:hypothetical protein [Streptomyces salyersiae]|uniref:Ribbon-helix-helix protein CopG domain-containing protein n=1 Tax=Streptomyces salyersiae TaxID=3075530 RepID=A0ABU2RVC9_9ACTN|nr:hypothetical protein [Streptomyces sp. DSM 41770]MDT0432791.1 hypothetical protein [Streptomyces sp. DSM 41770]
MATPKPTRRRRSPVSVPRTDEFDAALATVMRTGMTKADAVRLAVQFLAHGLQSAWDAGAVPDGTQPRRMLMRVERQDTPQLADQRE